MGTVSRGSALLTGANFRTAHVFVLDGTGRLLLQRLAASRDRHPGRWGSSVAAYLYAGESYEHAARRRLREELGLHVSLRSVGKIEMHDEQSKKFVALFSALANRAAIREPEHVAKLRYWRLAEIEAAVEEDQTRFTPTFLQLLSYFRGSQ